MTAVRPMPLGSEDERLAAEPDGGVRAGGRPAAREFAAAYLAGSAEVLAAIPPDEVAELIEIARAARDAGRRVFTCGNGGSAATASHFASGLGKDASADGKPRFRALALTDNVAWITSLANDAAYAAIFVEQLKNHADPGDVLVAFSGSGDSPNVIEAVEWANDNGLVTVGVTGARGGKLAALARHSVRVRSEHIGHVEEGHFLIQHLVTYFFREAE